MIWFTGTSAVPSGTTILARMPSSTASTSIVALSVSISAITSPDLTVSPSFLSHLARLPFSIVGESAGMSTSVGMNALSLSHRFGRHRGEDRCRGRDDHTNHETVDHAVDLRGMDRRLALQPARCEQPVEHQRP